MEHSFPKTIIFRHRKENLKKCSLRGLELREDFLFFLYPKVTLFDKMEYILLAPANENENQIAILSEKDKNKGLLILDGTWKHVEKMKKIMNFSSPPQLRSLPRTLKTAYPRRQEDCPSPGQGLASIEAIFAAYYLLGRNTEGLLAHYYWREKFLHLNNYE